jgi:hypothetical protein
VRANETSFSFIITIADCFVSQSFCLRGHCDLENGWELRGMMGESIEWIYLLSKHLPININV